MTPDRKNARFTGNAVSITKEYAKLSSEYDSRELERFHKSLGYGRGRDVRTAFEKDRDRIIHCASFRRLQARPKFSGWAVAIFSELDSPIHSKLPKLPKE